MKRKKNQVSQGWSLPPVKLHCDRIGRKKGIAVFLNSVNCSLFDSEQSELGVACWSPIIQLLMKKNAKNSKEGNQEKFLVGT